MQNVLRLGYKRLLCVAHEVLLIIFMRGVATVWACPFLVAQLWEVC